MLSKRNLLFAIVIVLLSGCVHQLTSSQRTLWALNVYNAQYELWLDQALDPTIVEEDRNILKKDPKLITPDMIRPDLTDEQRDMLNKKKKILVELKPIVLTAAELNSMGSTPSVEMQNKLVELINRLLTLIGD